MANSWAVGLLTAGGVVGALSLTMTLSGCDTGDLIRVDVPQGVRESFGDSGRVVPTRVTYNESIDLYEDFIAAWNAQKSDFERESSRFAANIDKGAEWVGIANSFGNSAITAGIPLVSSIPGGGILSTLLVGAGALFLKAPGTQKKIDAAYEEGRAAAKTDATTGALVASGGAA